MKPNPSKELDCGYSFGCHGANPRFPMKRVSLSSSDTAGAPIPTPRTVLTNPAAFATRDEFGNALAAAGTWVAVGAAEDETGAEDAGVVYVYDFAGATPSQPTLTLTNPVPADSDRFGTALAFSGNRLIVGASGHDKSLGGCSIPLLSPFGLLDFHSGRRVKLKHVNELAFGECSRLRFLRSRPEMTQCASLL